MTLLETKGLTRYFGGLAAVSHLDIHVNEGEIVGLIGPNGAGKTTVFNLITGVLRPSEGKVIYNNKDITGKKPHVTARLGIGRTFQIASLFCLLGHWQKLFHRLNHPGSPYSNMLEQPNLHG